MTAPTELFYIILLTLLFLALVINYLYQKVSEHFASTRLYDSPEESYVVGEKVQASKQILILEGSILTDSVGVLAEKGDDLEILNLHKSGMATIEVKNVALGSNFCVFEDEIEKVR